MTGAFPTPSWPARLGHLNQHNAATGGPDEPGNDVERGTSLPQGPLVLFDRHENGMTHFAANRLRQVALAANIFDQDNLAGADFPCLSVARGDLRGAGCQERS